MEYSKPLKTIKVTTRKGNVITVSDTLDKPTASNAYWEFMALGTMHILADPNDFIPFHAVEMIEVTQSSEETKRTDPYCGKSGGSNRVCEAKACECEADC